MTYEAGEIILASDFTTFRTALLNVYDVGSGDSGYGQISGTPAVGTPIPSVIIGDIVQSNEWDEFITAAQICSDHQGSSTTFPPNAEVGVGEIIEAHESDPPTSDPYDIDGSLTTITTNRFNVDGGSSVSVYPFRTSTRAAAWSNQIVHQFRVTFSTVDDARYFFNSGGQIRFSGSRSGGAATPQNTNWTTLLSNMGTVTFDWDVTTAAGTNWTGSGIGYYDLTAGFQQLAQGVGTGAYAANDATIFGRTVDGPTGGNGDNGRTLEFRVEYNDDHSNVFSDSVTGTITSVIDYRIADVHLTIDTPVPTAPFIELTAGT